jgi:hypothetical protein
MGDDAERARRMAAGRSQLSVGRVLARGAPAVATRARPHRARHRQPSPDFTSEKLIAYESGWRAQFLPEATVSVSLFYNDYTDLRTTSPNP